MRLLNAAPYAVDTGEVEEDQVNANFPGVLLYVLKERIRFKEVGLEYRR